MKQGTLRAALADQKNLDSGGAKLSELYVDQAGRVIFNKSQEFKLSLTCFLAGGHLLIEDIPGVGKTTFVKTVARLLGLDFGRIQFTNDLLPADILGSAIYDTKHENFKFHPGPIFHQLILIDELNRANPKTQSALLQAMEENEITVEGETHKLPQPFFVIATQNPRFQVGTFSLPESQLDRFSMRIELGYPGKESETKLLMGGDSTSRLHAVETIFTPQGLREAKKIVEGIHVSQNVARYIQNILELSRASRKDILGLSTRAGLSLVNSSKAWAFLEGRPMVIPEDVQAVAPSCINHRVCVTEVPFQTSLALSRELVMSVAIR